VVFSAVLSMLLVVSLVYAVATPAAAAPPVAAPAKVVCPADRPDQSSALVAARLCGGRVGVSSLTTARTLVWAEANGTLSAEQSQGDVRVADGRGGWKPVDLSLVTRADGSVAPTAAPQPLVLSGAAGAGDHDVAVLGSGDTQIALGWRGALPAPVVAGSKATYVDVRLGVDLVLDVTRTGFEQSLVVKNRAAVAQVASIAMPWRSGALAASATARGLELRTSAGAVAALVGNAVMWDARVDAGSGQPSHTAAVGMAVTPVGAGRSDLVLTPDAALLADAATVFPVTIDPPVSIGADGDTYTESDFPSTSYWSATELKLGSYNSGGVKARSFLRFGVGAFYGSHVISATLTLWEVWSYSCTPANWQLWRTGYFDSTATWSNSPAQLTQFSSSSATKGHDSGCNPGQVGIDATGWFQAAADSFYPYWAMGLYAADENSSLGWKRFASSQDSNNSHVPFVSINYNAPPAVSGLSTIPTTAGCVSGAGRPWMTSKTPRLSATVSDPEASSSSLTFQWWITGGAQIGSTTVPTVPSGVAASADVPAGAFTDGGTYSWRVMATDAGGVSSAWSPWCEFTVDSVAPGVPNASSTQYPENGRGTAASGQFTFTPAGGDTDVAGFTYQLDTDTAPTTVAGTGATTVTVTPTSDGHRTLTVRAKDVAGNLSAPRLYVFDFGRAGISQPLPGATAVKRMKIALDVPDTNLTRVTLQYRRGPGGAEYSIPLPNVTTAAGAAITSWPVSLSTLGGNAIWNAVDTLGSPGGVVDVRGCMWTAADTACSYQTAWVSATVDPTGDGAAGASVGPGSVNLLTGDYTLNATDADELGLSVSRTASSTDPGIGWTPQGERLTSNQQQVGTDTTGFVGVGASIARSTTRGQASSTDSLIITPTSGTDTYASLGCDYAMCQGMQAGHRYRLTGWIYVPAATGLSPASSRGLRLAGYSLSPTGPYNEFYSPVAAWVDGWQQLSVDMDVPADGIQAFFRLYDGMTGGSGKVVYWDNLSLRELVAPFGPAWRGGAADATSGSDYTSLEFPTPDVAQIKTTDGGWITFAKSTSGQFYPEPGAEALSLVNVDANTYELRNIDGTVVQFTKPGGVGTFTFMASSTSTTEQNSTTSYVYISTDNRTLVSRVANPTEPGITGCNVAAPAVPGRGCEVLEYVYATATTATSTTPGDVKDQIKAVQLWTWDPNANAGAGAETAVEVAHYAYDDTHQLRQFWDPRVTPSLVTAYTYDTGHVGTITPAGQLPWTFDYGTIAADPTNPGRLHRVRRTALQQGSPTTIDPAGDIATRMVYDVPLTRAGGGPNDLDATTIATWGQHDLPTDATAIFGPEDDPGIVQATNTLPGQNGYGPATVHYLNASAQEVNTATPQAAGVSGAAIDTTQYDRFGNTVWTLQATDRLLALGQLPNSASMLSALGLTGADTATRAGAFATVNTYSADGIDLLDTLGPTMTLVLEQALADPDGTGQLPALAAGSTVVGRAHTVNAYDEGKPDSAVYHLQTTTTSGAAIAGYPDGDTRVTQTGYNPDNGSTSGWVLKAATSVTTDAGTGGAHLTAHTVYDSAGRATASWGIDSTGSDARTSLTIFYTAGTNTQDAACGNKPEWAGNACVTKKAGPVVGGDPSRGMSTNLSERRVTSFTRWGDTAQVTETVTGTTPVATRSTTTGYDAAGRVTGVAITSTNDGATPVPATSTDYSTSNGQVTATHTSTATIIRDYDLWGRVYRYTDADGGITTNEYDRYGKPTKVTDPTGNATFTYNRTLEPRGFVTAVTDSIAGTFTAGYSADGQLTTLHYPNGITRTDTLDTNLQPNARTYTRDSDSAVIYAETVVTNSQGQAVNQTYTGGNRTYSYDRLGRLTSTAETTDGNGCTTRVYGYDNRTNRTNRSTYNPDTNGACRSDATGATPDVTTPHTYDTADRITDTGYTYDAFGRITALPGGLTNTFYANDLVNSQILGTSRQDFTLDPSHRFRGYTTATLTAGTWTQTNSRLNHYGDDSDSPRWIVENTGSGALTRMVSGPDGSLAATTTTAGSAQFQLVNLHGDVITTTDTAAMPAALNHYDEFGVPEAGQAQNRYGWLGGKQRSAEALGGVILMGVRLYQADTGRFLQPDPVPGGSATAYDYCNADPVNTFDLAGTWPTLPGWAKSTLSVVAKVGEVASYIPGPIGTAAAAISAVSYAATGNYAKAGEMALTAAANLVGCGAVVHAAVHVIVGAVAVAKVAKIAVGAVKVAGVVAGGKRFSAGKIIARAVIGDRILADGAKTIRRVGGKGRELVRRVSDYPRQRIARGIQEGIVDASKSVTGGSIPSHAPSAYIGYLAKGALGFVKGFFRG
jgi:RHS repeat-associated protein